MSRHLHPQSKKLQRGAVLFVALIFLVLLTLLGLTAAGTSVLQERMTGGMRNAQLAMMGSESALRAGEVDLWAAAQRSNYGTGGLAIPPCAGTGVQPCYYERTNGIADDRVKTFRSSRTWLGTTDGADSYNGALTGLTGDASTANLVNKPRYMIEDLGLDLGAGQRPTPSGALLSAPSASGAPKIRLYRVTSRSQGCNAAKMRVTESVFGTYSINAGFNPNKL